MLPTVPFVCPQRGDRCSQGVVRQRVVSGEKDVSFGGGDAVGNLWEFLRKATVNQGEAAEEGSEPGALCGCDALCHGPGRRGGVL